MKKFKYVVTLTSMMSLLLVSPIRGDVFASSNIEHASSLEETVTTISDSLLTGYGVTNLHYAIRDQGELVLSEGFSMQPGSDKVKESTNKMYGIGSVSKMYVTAATMMLVDKGQLNIDTPLVEYIEEFKMADERYKLITPRMLMNHTSGLYGSHYKNSILFSDNDTINHDTLLEELSKQSIKSNPGEYAVYTNDGFQLLELLVERISGLSYSEFIAKYISTPLQLESTKTPLQSFEENRLSPTYFPGLNDALPIENANVIGTGGIYATAEELTTFAELLIGNHPQLLSKQATQLMQADEYRRGIWVKDNSNSFNYGLGWDAVQLAPFDEYGIKALTKGGDTILYHSALIVLPEHDISIALLTSGGSSIFNTAAATTILLAYLVEEGHISKLKQPADVLVPKQQLMPKELKMHSGLYGTVGGTINILVEDGAVTLPALMDGFIAGQRYVYTGNEIFTSEDGFTTISFDVEKNNNVYLSVSSLLSFPGVGETALAYYEYQKLDVEVPELSLSTKKAWENRDGVSYYAIDEKASSVFYLSPLLLKQTITLSENGLYANGTIIVDSNFARNSVEIPVMNGRDAFDLSFITMNDTEYLQAAGRTYIHEASIKPIYAGKQSTVTINQSGDARWYTIPHKAVGKTMEVDLSENTSFAVYDENGMPINLYTATGEKTVNLPVNGLIVFTGEANKRFNVKIY